MGGRYGWLTAALLAGVAGPAWAGEKPLYQSAPAWVKPAPPIDAAKLADDAPLLVTWDNQNRLENGVVWTYTDVARRLATPDLVASGGTVSISWQPAKGDLFIHKVEILRGAERLDVLADGKQFTVIRREQQLERQQLDGRLTATMAVEGLRVGDVLHVITSQTRREDALGGGMQAAVIVPQTPTRVGYARTRFVWPAGAGVRWRSYGDGAVPTESRDAGASELTYLGAEPKAAELPADAPGRFRKPPLIEASTFTDWAAVSKVMAPLYVTAGKIAPGGALAGEVAKIKAADPDPLRRTAAALQLVQENVRYLFNGLDQGNYVPQSPEQTWSLRYGDCKAKTLLLLAVLHDLGVEAEPVLASLGMGDMVAERLPSAGAFNHILVRATIGGETFWLDGTGAGSRYANLRDTPPLHWVLPVRAGGAALMAVPARAPAEAGSSVELQIDQSAGLTLPAPAHAVVTLRGAGAQVIGLARSQGSKEQKDKLVTALLVGAAGVGVNGLALSGYTLSYDPARGVATVDATAVIPSGWRRQDGRWRLTLDRMVEGLHFAPDRARPAWAAIPVATGAPERLERHLRIRLPADAAGVALDGAPTLADTLGGVAIRRTATLSDGVLAVDEVGARDGAEIAPAAVTAERAKAALAHQRLLKAVAPVDLPPAWKEAIAARRDGRFKPALAAYAQAIAAQPDEPAPYLARAEFLLHVYDRRGALPDLDKALTLRPSAPLYLVRAEAWRQLGDDAHAAADAKAALALDPAAYGAIRLLGEMDVDAGRRDAALARVQDRIDAGGEAKSTMVALKAELLARAGDGPAAIAALDGEIAERPGVPSLLNSRCWVKGEVNTGLDTALKDCTRALELTENGSSILDSRALVYLRMNRLDEAMADLDAALELNPDQVGSLYLRGVIRSRQGKGDAQEEIAAVREIEPTLPAEYARYGIKP